MYNYIGTCGNEGMAVKELALLDAALGECVFHRRHDANGLAMSLFIFTCFIFKLFLLFLYISLLFFESF